MFAINKHLENGLYDSIFLITIKTSDILKSRRIF